MNIKEHYFPKLIWPDLRRTRLLIKSIDDEFGEGAAMRFLERRKHTRIFEDRYGEGAMARCLEKYPAGDCATLLFMEKHGRPPTLADLLAEHPDLDEDLLKPVIPRLNGELDRIEDGLSLLERHRKMGAEGYRHRGIVDLVSAETLLEKQRKAAAARSRYRSDEATELCRQVVDHAKKLLISDEITREEFYRRLEQFTDVIGEKRARRTIRGYLKGAGVKPPPK
ncbi:MULTISPECIES: hypothetical protein [unclassified Guyparkeria]|uniref:hypothetical protein n=1 Tax=unclassified Guyparkeria TaxID=2626246 RepID=UPI0007334088|nr:MULTISPECIES: hypothetical protein [unclassified Guyparkeria]KTG15990.1 hypothetical protein AUR63_05950 [Guyparkeria sp. XI15]OAE84745.1 hypothetical protein AWR35_05960 [Guyparkeria sp. WRN-7]